MHAVHVLGNEPLGDTLYYFYSHCTFRAENFGNQTGPEIKTTPYVLHVLTSSPQISLNSSGKDSLIQTCFQTATTKNKKRYSTRTRSLAYLHQKIINMETLKTACLGL